MGIISYSAASVIDIVTSEYCVNTELPISLILAGIVEKHAIQYDDDESCEKVLNFIDCFKVSDDYKMKIFLKSEWKSKENLMWEYIDFMYGLTNSEQLSQLTINFIANISKKYCAYREAIRKNISNLQYSTKYLEYEHNTYEILTNSMYKSRKLRNSSSKDVLSEIRLFTPRLRVDHVIELQLLAHAISETRISNIEDIIIFMNYFNDDFNLQRINEIANRKKRQLVKKYLDYNLGYWKYFCNMNQTQTELLESIQEFYMANHGKVIDKIRRDRKITKSQRMKFEEVEKCLYYLIINE